jgi:SAM-dependent methyltransferase
VQSLSHATPPAPAHHETLDLARQVIRALASVPNGEQVPAPLIASARQTLREVSARLAEIEMQRRRETAACRHARDAISALLYDRARGDVNVETIASDAGVTEATARRAAGRVGVTQRRPRRAASRPAADADHTLMTMPEVEPPVPNVARMYDYLLGGPNNFAVDRDQVNKVRESNPEAVLIAQQNRAFLARAVRTLTRAGIRQFLDIGSGIPAQGNVHEIAQDIEPDARVVYVDNDPVVLTYGRSLLAGDRNTTMIHGDLRHPREILDHPRTHAVLDLSKPVAVLLVAVLHWVKDDSAANAAVATLRHAITPGSYLAVSHVVDVDDHRFDKARKVTSANVIPGNRSRADISEFFGDFSMLDPGLVPITTWRPDTPRIAEGVDPETVWAVAGVGRKT